MVVPFTIDLISVKPTRVYFSIYVNIISALILFAVVVYLKKNPCACNKGTTQLSYLPV